MFFPQGSKAKLEIVQLKTWRENGGTAEISEAGGSSCGSDPACGTNGVCSTSLLVKTLHELTKYVTFSFP